MIKTPGIPIIVICHNNHHYVNNTIEQFKKTKYLENVIILDNDSKDEETVKFLKSVESVVKVIYNGVNVGPWVSDRRNMHIYNMLPSKFIVTDPDLQFNEYLPENFIEILEDISEYYKCRKVGFSIDISDFDEMFQTPCPSYRGQNIYNWCIKFWKKEIRHPSIPLYDGDIDTTFHLFNKKYFNKGDVQVAGNFTCKHIPWYVKNPFQSLIERYNHDRYVNKYSTTSSMLIQHVEEYLLTVKMYGEKFLIKPNEDNTHIYFLTELPFYKPSTIQIMDKYLDKEKIFIDIGAWMGYLTLYGSRYSKKVYSIEANKHLNYILDEHQYMNSLNIIPINKVFYHINGEQVLFGSGIHESSQNKYGKFCSVNIDGIKDESSYNIETINLNYLIESEKIDPNMVSLIKVNICGGEEDIFNNLYDFSSNYHVPILITFYYSWWKNKDLDRFPFLENKLKNLVMSDNMVDILIVN